MQISKKDHNKKKPTKEEGHWEGKYWCNCLIRGYRLWLGKKKYGSTNEQIKDQSKVEDKLSK